MDMLLAPVYAQFCAVADKYLAASGGFVVGPIGADAATRLFEYAVAAGRRDSEFPNRFYFDSLLPGVIYESQSDGAGGYRYLGLIDEIVTNHRDDYYYDRTMKPGEGHHGEKITDERMPAFVRFRKVTPISKVMAPKTQLFPADLGLSAGFAILRYFDVQEVRRTDLRRTFDKLITHYTGRTA